MGDSMIFKNLAVFSAAILFCVTPVCADEKNEAPPQPVMHLLPVTDEDLQTMQVVGTDIGKLCPVSDDDCLAQVKMRDLMRRWRAALDAEKKEPRK